MSANVIKPTALGRVRLACFEDAHTVMGLVNEAMAMNFRVMGPARIEYLIENCVLSICQHDVEEKMVGFLAVRDYPLVPAVHPCAWEEHVWMRYKTVEMNARNTLFIHLLCWEPVYGRELVDNMLKSVFMHDPYLHYIAMIKSVLNHPYLIPNHSRPEGSFRRVTALEKGIPGDMLPVLCIADRSEVSPRLRIRRAVEEDNDDIVPILEAHSERLQQLYGEFYISELISRHPESERVLLVCEHNSLAVGIMCLNTQINYDSLEESFDLAPFAGLRKIDQVPPDPKRSKDADNLSSVISYSIYGNNNNEKLRVESISRPRATKSNSQVTWVGREEAPEYVPDSATDQMYSLGSAHMDVLHMLEEEEDEMEFDIVNIDTALLRVPPRLLSYDDLLGPEPKQGPTETIKKVFESVRKESDVKRKLSQKGSIATIPVVAAPVGAKTPDLPRYSGPPNAFLLELFAMNQDYDERYGFDILEVAYELFPDRDYCVICLPSSHASFPLLEHFTLVTAFGNRMRYVNETLYVAHVNSVRGHLRVRIGEAYDIPALTQVWERAPQAQGLMDLFESSLSSYWLESFVLLSQNQPVGVVVLKPLEDGTSVRTQYDLEPEPRRPGTDGMILAGIMSPALEPHSRWFMRELLRITKYSTLFWLCRLFARGEFSPTKNLMSLAGHMTPVHPRRSVPNMSGNKDLDKIYKDISTPFALWVMERPLLSLPKVYVNNSIVVVGASRTGLAFLETLLLGPTCQYLTFSNVTLVSEHGLPTVSECLRAADTCVPRDGRYTDRYLKSVPFYFYFDVMSAVMVEIDRKKKCIYLKGGGVKCYDELVLTCGKQFQHPNYLHDALELAKEVELGKPCDRILMDDPQYHPEKVPSVPELPTNVMLVNSLFQANLNLRRLLRMISETSGRPTALSAENQVIVYGDCVEAYSCIAALLELGISAEMITFVEPFPADDPTKLRVNCFNNETVDRRVQETLEDLGIRIYRKYYLTDWKRSSGSDSIESISLLSLYQAIQLPCFALFYYGLKAIDVNAFKAINESGLVYDGGLVVGPSFETNDPNVYGAGTCVKYSRRLYARTRAHKHFCSEDVGEALAKMFLKKFDPFVMGTEKAEELMPRFSSSMLGFRSSFSSASSTSRLSMAATKMPTRWQPVLKFESPIMQSATLPGPLYYMKLRKPGRENPMQVQQCLPHQGHTLITDLYDNYFRLQLNVLHCVEAVTCLSEKQFSCEILSQLYGKHEAFFNNLLIRFQMNQIHDLYEFFTQPWISALYQETFQDLLRDLNEQDVTTVYNVMKDRYKVTYVENAATTTRPATLTKTATTSKSATTTKPTGIRRISDYSVTSSTSKEILAPQAPLPKDTTLGTFRSVIDKFVARTSVTKFVKDQPADIPSECGQSAAIREEAADFWRTIGGERIVVAHLAEYLDRNNVTNPHYAAPNSDHT